MAVPFYVGNNKNLLAMKLMSIPYKDDNDTSGHLKISSVRDVKVKVTK